MRESEHLRDFGPDRNIGSFVFKWVVFIVLLGGAAGALSWGMGWLSAPGQITSVENVRKQWAFAYTFDESLQSAARQVCAAERALEGAQLPDERTQRRSQVLALENNYARIQAEYNARLRNAFEAKLVAPSDVPERAPDLASTKTRVCQ